MSRKVDYRYVVQWRCQPDQEWQSYTKTYTNPNDAMAAATKLAQDIPHNAFRVILETVTTHTHTIGDFNV